YGLIQCNLQKAMGAPMGLKEGIDLTFVSYAVNCVSPGQFGTVLRAAYLKRVHSFSFSYFISAAVGVSVAFLLFAAAFSLAGLAWMQFGEGRRDLAAVWAIAAANFGVAIGILAL